MENKHPLADCAHCPLADEPYVPSLIPLGEARLAVVGEAPGFHESVRKEPFKGPSGQLLDKVLNHHGFKRSEVLYTNVVACRPPDNANPPKAAITACRQRLLGELGGSGAGDVVALGGTATNALVDDPRTITSLRVGPPKRPTSALRGSSVQRVIPTWHPAYCLRNADAFPTLVDDIEKVTRHGFSTWKEPDWKYFDEVPLALQALNALIEWQDQKQRYELVVDIEVGIEKDTAFDHPNHYQMLCIGLAYTKGKAIVIGEEAVKDKSVIALLDKLLRRSKLIAQNGKFDLAGLYPLIPRLELWFDTMLGHYVLDERPGGHGLKVMAIERLGAPAYDDAIKQFVPRGGNYANIPREILYKYNAYDVACTWDLFEEFVPLLDAPITDWPYEDQPVRTLRDVHDFLVEASNQIMYLELNGITIDREYSNQLQEDYLQELAAIELEIDNIVLQSTQKFDTPISQINPRSPKQVSNYLESQGVRVASTNKETLAGILERTRDGVPVHEFVSTLLDHRRRQKLYGTYIKGIRNRLYRGRVYTTYMLHGTTSGRLASRNPNLQNIVRDKAIRKQFAVSKPENVLIQADYKQAEGRVITYLAQDEYLRSIFCDPTRDLFDELSNQLYGVDNWRKEVERVRTKAFFYGLSYGREALSIALEFKMPLSEATSTMRTFMDLIPATTKWQSQVRRRVLDGKELVTPFGRRRRFSLITDQNKKDVLNEALSYLPQSTASDICLSALIRLRPLLRGMAFIRLTIHDALVVECAKQRQDEVSELLAKVMVEVGREFTEYVPFDVDLSSGPSWGSL